MAEYGEWQRKGATLSDVTARKEYGIDQEFIERGIRAGKLEWREGSIWGNPYLRLLRGQLEAYIVAEFGPERLAAIKDRTELRKVTQEIRELKVRLSELEDRKEAIERRLKRPEGPSR